MFAENAGCPKQIRAACFLIYDLQLIDIDVLVLWGQIYDNSKNVCNHINSILSNMSVLLYVICFLDSRIFFIRDFG